MTLLCACAVAAAAAPAASAGFVPGGRLPGACAVPGFADHLGSTAGDVLVVRAGAERVYGLDGGDWLVGSRTAPGCLFGGAGDDVVTMLEAGGVGYGEEGDDILTGGTGRDALTGGPGADALAGGAQTDILRGNRGVDGLAGGDGDDLLDGRDGRGEVLDCGPGADTVVADARDVLLGCERGTQDGAPMPAYAVRPRAAGPRRVFRTRVPVPRDADAGGYRLLISSACVPGLQELRRFPAAGRSIDAGEVARLRLRPPAGGWCGGRTTGLVVRQPECPPGHQCVVPRPVEVVGRLVVRVR